MAARKPVLRKGPMTTNRYGYRVYTLAVGKRNSWRETHPESLGSLGPSHVARVVALLKSHTGEILKYTPDLRPPDDLTVPVPLTDTGEPVLVIESFQASVNMVRCEVIHGRLGDHDELVGDNVEQIGDKAAGRRYRVDLMFPVTGTYGMAVVETCQRFSPADHLLRWLAYFDKCRAFEAAAKLADAVEAGAGDDAPVQLTAETDWRKHRMSQISDAKYLRTLISGATKVSVDLVQAGAVTKRGRYKEVEHRLQVPNVDEGTRADLAGEILLWLEGGKAKGAVKQVECPIQSS